MATRTPSFSKKSSPVARSAPAPAAKPRSAPAASPVAAVVDRQVELGTATDAMIAAGVAVLAVDSRPAAVLRAMVEAPGALDHSGVGASGDVEAAVQRVALRNGQAPADIVAAWYRAACGVA